MDNYHGCAYASVRFYLSNDLFNCYDMKLYIQEHDERCHTKDYHLRYMEECGITELKVYEAKIEYGTGYFFCKEFGEVGEVGESCGKQCEKYKPRNGKNGRCSHSANVYERTDKFIILKL